MNCRHFWLIQAYKKLSAELTKSLKLSYKP